MGNQEATQVGNDVEHEEHSSMVLKGVQPLQQLWKSIQRFCTKLEIDLSEDPAIPILDIYPKDTSSYLKNTCSSMFIVALFLVVRHWKQPRCYQPKNGKRKCGTYAQGGIIQLLKTKTCFCRQMDGTEKKNIIMEVTQTQNNKYVVCSLISRH